MRRKLEGKRMVVTGASSGIGYALSLQLAEAGAWVLATARRQEKLDQLLATFQNMSPSGRGRLAILPGDITLPETRTGIMEWVDLHFEGLDGLVNNAGLGAYGPFSQAGADRLSQVLAVDLVAPMELTRLAYPRLRKGYQPFVLMVGSVLGHRAVPWKSEYCAAKFGLRGFAEALRIEWQRDGIDILHVSPSTTRSEFFEVMVDAPSQTKQGWGAMTPAAVAQCICKSIEQGKRDRILSIGGKALAWAGTFFPKWLDRALQLTPAPNVPSESEPAPKS